MALRELWKVVIIFFINANDYYNSSECYSDYFFDVNGQFKENKSCFRVNERKGIHNSIDEKLAAILGDLHLILAYYRLHHLHA